VQIKVEHWTFGLISTYWKGAHRTVVELIATTTARSALIVHADRDTGNNPTPVKGAKYQDVTYSETDNRAVTHSLRVLYRTVLARRSAATKSGAPSLAPLSL
jgi:hypothetical protein